MNYIIVDISVYPEPIDFQARHVPKFRSSRVRENHGHTHGCIEDMHRPLMDKTSVQSDCRNCRRCKEDVVQR